MQIWNIIPFLESIVIHFSQIIKDLLKNHSQCKPGCCQNDNSDKTKLDRRWWTPMKAQFTFWINYSPEDHAIVEQSPSFGRDMNFISIELTLLLWTFPYKKLPHRKWSPFFHWKTSKSNLEKTQDRKPWKYIAGFGCELIQIDWYVMKIFLKKFNRGIQSIHIFFAIFSFGEFSIDWKLLLKTNIEREKCLKTRNSFLECF